MAEHPDVERDEEPTVDWGQPRSKTITWHDPTAVAAAGVGLAGIEHLRAISAGRLPPPPIAALLGMQIREIEPGRVSFECVPDESAYNPIGTVHGGLVCTLADTVVGCAVQSTLDAGVGYTSIDLNVSYLRPVTSASGMLVAVGRVTKSGRRVSFADAEIVDATGRAVATATSSLLVIDGRVA